MAPGSSLRLGCVLALCLLTNAQALATTSAAPATIPGDTAAGAAFEHSTLPSPPVMAEAPPPATTIEEKPATADSSGHTPWHWALNEKVRRISGFGIAILMGSMLLLSYIDRRHTRHLAEAPPMTVLIPCYNDGASIEATLASVFANDLSGRNEVIVINDASRDDSGAQLERLQQRYPFRLIVNPVNRGKAVSLNEAAREARHEIILCIDADTELNRKAATDMLARFAHDDRVGAVSCPYRPSNRGFLPAMQAIEYSMLLLTQGAHNLTSAMALWGGCLMVRREAFKDAGGFSIDAITEDVDLAFKLNRTGWRVEQSFVAVRSSVPSTVRAWVRQKLRWTAGGMQCYIRHVPVWFRNPSQITFILAYSLLILSSIPAVLADLHLGEDMVDIFNALNRNNTVMASIIAMLGFYGRDLLRRMLGSGLCCLLSTIYIFPLIKRPRQIWKLLLVFPFSLLYFPAYIIVSLFGIANGIRSLRRLLPSDVRGW